MKNNLKNIWNFIVKYKYIISILVFGIWIIFLDQTGLVYKSKLNEEIEFLNKKKEHYKEEIDKNETYFKDLQSNPNTKERLAREKYYMSKKDEDVYIIQDETEE